MKDKAQQVAPGFARMRWVGCGGVWWVEWRLKKPEAPTEVTCTKPFPLWAIRLSSSTGKKRSWCSGIIVRCKIDFFHIIVAFIHINVIIVSFCHTVNTILPFDDIKKFV